LAADGRGAYFAGTAYESDTCPRRQLINHPDLGEVFTLWRSCEGRPGIGALETLTCAALQCLDVINEARAAKTEEELNK
jgi:hypothetical protein